MEHLPIWLLAVSIAVSEDELRFNAKGAVTLSRPAGEGGRGDFEHE